MIFMKILVWNILEIFISFVIVFRLFLIKLLKRKPLIKTIDGIEDVVMKLLAGGALIYFVYAGVFPAIRDIPNLIQKKICTIEGVAQEDCSSSKLNRMSVHIVDEETKEVQYITFFYGDPIDEGDRLTVQYLPNLKFGVLIERNGEITGKRIE